MSYIDERWEDAVSIDTNRGSEPLIHALIASFLALGGAVSGTTLRRAGASLRGLISDPESQLSPATVRIIEDILVGVDHEEPIA
jgi:hypothetical protein